MPYNHCKPVLKNRGSYEGRSTNAEDHLANPPFGAEKPRINPFQDQLINTGKRMSRGEVRAAGHSAL